MIWFLLTLTLNTSVWMFVVKVSPTYQAQEKDNVTIGWDSQTKTDISLTNLFCFLQSEPPKVFYEMINGAEYPESQHQQFARRVQLDKDALRGGRISLHLSAVTAEDSGNYWCDLAANYNKNVKRWELETSEKFVLKVSRTSDGDNSDVSLNNVSPKGSKRTGRNQHKEYVYLAIFIGALFTMVVTAYCLLITTELPQRGQDIG